MQDAATVWITGLPGAGKTTLARLLSQRLRAHGRSAVLLDGDTLRAGLSSDLTFSAADRAESTRRAAEVAKLLNDAGIWVVAALISPRRLDRQRVRAIIGADRVWVAWARAPLSVCESRDPKGLYARARAGRLAELTGVAAPYEDADDADLQVDTSRASPEASTEALWSAISARACLRSISTRMANGTRDLT